MAYSIYSLAGCQPIADTSTTQRHPIGLIVQGRDPTYGNGEFIYLLGVASTVVGSLVTFNATSGLTTLSPTNATSDSHPVAVAMSANVATQYGWYQVQGLAVVKKTNVAVSPGVALYLSGTAGRVYVTASSGKGFVGMRAANLTSVTTTTSTVVALLNRPAIEAV